MAKSLHIKNAKKAATHKLLKLIKDKPFVKYEPSELFSEKNKHKATSCTKQRRLKYGSAEKAFIDTTHLKNLPRKAKKAAKKLLLAK
jgi:hypothetical protein